MFFHLIPFVSVLATFLNPQTTIHIIASGNLCALIAEANLFDAFYNDFKKEWLSSSGGWEKSKEIEDTVPHLKKLT